MIRTLFCVLPLLLAASAVYGDTSGKDGDKQLSGMSIVGNDEAPKSLVIVPWKDSELGATLEVSRARDDGRQPVDRDVFGRVLDYYEIRSGSHAERSAAGQ